MDRVKNFFYYHWDTIILVMISVLVSIGIVFLILFSSGVFFTEVENYNVTAVVTDKDHYTSMYFTRDEELSGSESVSSSDYNNIFIGDFVTIHVSIKEDSKGNLHTFSSYMGKSN